MFTRLKKKKKMMRRGKRKEKKRKSSVTKFPSVFYKFFYIVVSISRFIVELERWFSLLYNHIVLQSTTFVPTFVGHETHFLKKKMPIAPLSTRTVGNKIKRDRSKRREREREREKYPERVWRCNRYRGDWKRDEQVSRSNGTTRRHPFGDPRFQLEPNCTLSSLLLLISTI